MQMLPQVRLPRYLHVSKIFLCRRPPPPPAPLIPSAPRRPPSRRWCLFVRCIYNWLLLLTWFSRVYFLRWFFDGSAMMPCIQTGELLRDFLIYVLNAWKLLAGSVQMQQELGVGGRHWHKEVLTSVYVTKTPNPCSLCYDTVWSWVWYPLLRSDNLNNSFSCDTLGFKERVWLFKPFRLPPVLAWCCLTCS